MFLYRGVLTQDLGIQIDTVRAKRSRHLATVLTKAKAVVIIDRLPGVYQCVV